MTEDRADRQAAFLTDVALIYHAMLDHHGAVPAGVCWSDLDGQLLRFDLLCAGIDTARTVTVNDVGCGYGALFDYLASRFALSGYCGTDICEAMLQEAGRRVSGPQVRFEQSALPVAVADWSLASGTFNLSGGADPDEWRELVRLVLTAMARHSRTGLAFNMLLPDALHHSLWGSEPAEWIDFCAQRLHGQPTLVHHPGGREWTLRVLLPHG